MNDVEAAIRYFEERGLKSIPETKKFDENGKCFFTYLRGKSAALRSILFSSN